MNMEDWEKSYDDFYIKSEKDKKKDDLLREVVGDYLNDTEKKQLLDE
tara:strand:- start:139 stop:279 length:141 start_codon:yes stop_codon:yes gene_type:complete